MTVNDDKVGCTFTPPAHFPLKGGRRMSLLLLECQYLAPYYNLLLKSSQLESQVKSLQLQSSQVQVARRHTRASTAQERLHPMRKL